MKSLANSYRTFVMIAAVLGFIGVGLGAFGTHSLAATFEANGRAGTFETAIQYHMYHVLALLAAAFAGLHWPSRLIQWAGYLLMIGVVLFSGSLYILAIFDLRIMGAVAPLGGGSFLAGWALLALAVWRGEKVEA